MLYHQIKLIYPSIGDQQFQLQNDGHGDYIKQWDYGLPQPTSEQLDAVLDASIQRSIYTKKVVDANKALADTNNLVVMALEDGTEIPQEIKDLRAAAKQVLQEAKQYGL